MHYIKEIVNGKCSERTKGKFVRYSKGTFVGPLLKIRFTKDAIKVHGSFHFVDELIDLVAEVLGEKEVHIKGSLVWNRDLNPELSKVGIKYSKVTKSRGLFKYVLDNNVRFKSFVEMLGDFNLLLSVKTDEVSLISKPTFPKPNKEFTNDFCKATFPISMKKRILEEFAFDVEEDFKVVEIKHTIEVNNIDIPKDVDSFEEARRLAKREGEIERIIIIDNKKETKKKFNFSA